MRRDDETLEAAASARLVATDRIVTAAADRRPAADIITNCNTRSCYACAGWLWCTQVSGTIIGITKRFPSAPSQKMCGFVIRADVKMSGLAVCPSFRSIGSSEFVVSSDFEANPVVRRNLDTGRGLGHRADTFLHRLPRIVRYELPNEINLEWVSHMIKMKEVDVENQNDDGSSPLEELSNIWPLRKSDSLHV